MFESISSGYALIMMFLVVGIPFSFVLGINQATKNHNCNKKGHLWGKWKNFKDVIDIKPLNDGWGSTVKHYYDKQERYCKTYNTRIVRN